MSLRPRKDAALKGAEQLTPQYVELLIDLQKGGGRFSFSSEIASIQNRLGSYVLMYDDERKISRAFFLYLLGEDGFKEFTSEIETAAPEEQQAFLDEISDFENASFYEGLVDFQIPQSPKEWEAAKISAEEMLEQLPEAERKETEKRGAFLWCFIFSSFLNTLSLMVHGAKMTSLVPQAMAGSEEAFLKAVQIDRMLLLHHPYFRDRKFRAQNEGETEFLSKLSYRESNPMLRGKIRYPGLYMLFGILDTFQWLGDLRREEILDLCDSAELDRYQNRIEDVNYLTKRLIEYRRWQKTRGLSMR